jgi:hypothetical protein
MNNHEGHSNVKPCGKLGNGMVINIAMKIDNFMKIITQHIPQPLT